MVRGSLRKLEDVDGHFLEKALLEQKTNPRSYPLSEDERKKLQVLTVKTHDSKEVVVSVPVKGEGTDASPVPEQETRESIRVQAALARMGERMGFRIWLPKNDRKKVTEHWTPEKDSLLSSLPMNYNDTTLKTIENIDVIWVRGGSIVRAFEVEHTTAVYSGILRMADLMALQPNLKIEAHIVAPADRREKVLMEITRPVFAMLQSGPLAETCTFVPYEAVEELSKVKLLEHMSDSVIEEFEEYAEETA